MRRQCRQVLGPVALVSASAVDQHQIASGVMGMAFKEYAFAIDI